MQSLLLSPLLFVCHSWKVTLHQKFTTHPISSEILRPARATSDINTLVKLSNHLLKKMMQKQGSKHRSRITMLNKIFGKHFTVSQRCPRHSSKLH